MILDVILMRKDEYWIHVFIFANITLLFTRNRPSDRAYILQTSFPVKELTDSEATLKDSGLLNSVVLQRYQ